MTFNPNYTRSLASAISQSSATEQALTNQLSSGLRVTQLSDDPVAAAKNVGLASSISRLDSFTQSATSQQSRMQVADNALGAVVSQVTSALSLAVSGGNGTLSAVDLQSLRTQVSTIRASVVALGNTSYQGQYLFAGSKGGTAPFTLDTSTDPATATYNGDSVTETMQTPDGQKIPVNVPGSSVFTAGGASLLGTLNQLVSDLGSGSATNIQADSTALTAALGAVTGQRAILDSGLSRVMSATTYASTESTVYQAQQSALLSADPASLATDLKTAEVQQQALLGVTATLESQQNLFAYLK
jgi:flagellar hook-associated protein 3 FlgL